MTLTQAKAEFQDSILNSFIPFIQKTKKFLLHDSFIDYEYPQNASFTLVIELSHEQLVFKRKVYSLLDMIGDIGGLYDGLFFIAGFLIRYFNHSTFDVALVTTLFKFQKTPLKSPLKILKVSNFDVTQMLQNIENQEILELPRLIFLFSRLFCKSKCSHSYRAKLKQFDRAKQEINDCLDISQMLRYREMTRILCQGLLSPQNILLARL